MKFSTKAEYGLRAMVELAAAYGSGPLTLSDIARSQEMPLGYLEQVAACLRRAELVKGTRGARGGYCLAASPASITVGQVLRALEGPLQLVECASEGEGVSCRREADCSSRLLWLRLRDSIAQVLEATTLADLGPGRLPLEDEGQMMAVVAPGTTP